MFWVCVALSVAVVFAAWLVITKDRLAQAGIGMRQEARGVIETAKSVEGNTQTERDQIKKTLDPIISGVQSTIDEAKKRKRALETVSPYFEEQIK